MSYTLRTGQTIAGLHPDDVEAAAEALDFHGGQLGPGDDTGEYHDAMAHAIAAYLESVRRREAEERAHARRHEEASRETALLLKLAEARRLAQAYISADADAVRAGRVMQAQGCPVPVENSALGDVK